MSLTSTPFTQIRVVHTGGTVRTLDVVGFYAKELLVAWPLAGIYEISLRDGLLRRDLTEMGWRAESLENVKLIHAAMRKEHRRL
jgi:hypothetical protein